MTFALTFRTSPFGLIRPELPPEVLAQKAREALSRIGYDKRPRDEAYGFDWDGQLVDYAKTNDKPAPQWRTVLSERPSPLTFWYRRSDDAIRSALLPFCRRRESDAAPQRRRVVEHSISHDEFYRPDVVDVRERIRVQNEQVGALAGFHRADVIRHVHHACRHNRRRLQRLHRREAGINIELDLAIHGICRHRLIGPGDQRHAGAMQRPDQVEKQPHRAAGRIRDICGHAIE